jgi:hypothetical protein
VECLKDLGLSADDGTLAAVEQQIERINDLGFSCSVNPAGAYCAIAFNDRDDDEEYCDFSQKLGCCLPTFIEAFPGDAAATALQNLEDDGCPELAGGSVCPGFQFATVVLFFF